LRAQTPRGAINVRDEIKANIKKGVIKKERRRSHENFVITVPEKKN
jgi:hypothetical protein